MTTARTYGDGCAIARALDVIGERWALLVVRELLLGPKRYTDLRHGLPTASPTVVSQRLGELESAGVIRRRKLPPPAGARVYELTDWGHQLEQIVMSLGQWAARSPAPRPHDARIVSADSVILALRVRFDAGAAQGMHATYDLRLAEDRFHIDVIDGTFEVARGEVPHADTRIETDPDTLSAVLWSGRSVAEAQRSKAMTIDGLNPTLDRFIRLFPAPDPVSPTAIA